VRLCRWQTPMSVRVGLGLWQNGTLCFDLEALLAGGVQGSAASVRDSSGTADATQASNRMGASGAQPKGAPFGDFFSGAESGSSRLL